MTHSSAAQPAPDRLSVQLEVNLSRLRTAFSDCSDLIFHDMEAREKSCCIVYMEGIADANLISQEIIAPLIHLNQVDSGSPPEFRHQSTGSPGITPARQERTCEFSGVVDGLLNGFAVVLTDGSPEATVAHAAGGQRRGVEEPATEAVVRGPREGFTENLRTNTALLRFKIKSTQLKTVSFTIGEQTRTQVVLAYIEGIADPGVIREASSRLQRIRIDGILESGYIEELIEDEPYSPFPQLQYTERPDTAAAHLLEGRFAILVDGTPFVLMAPVVFWGMLQASEDYYERYLIGTLIRWLRLIFMFVALFLPGLYVAVTTYHQDMLPSNLLLSIAAARESIPFPALVEAFIMEIAFEGLREAGIRLPKTVGQAVSILGALVIGQSAVQAGIVSAPMVIIVSLTGIASFTIPRFNMAISIRMLRFPLMVLAGLFGLFGMVVGTMWIAVHLCGLRSFGVPYMSGIAPLQKGEPGDILVRTPWWNMLRRPQSIGHRNRRRMAWGMQPKQPQPPQAAKYWQRKE